MNPRKLTALCLCGVLCAFGAPAFAARLAIKPVPRALLGLRAPVVLPRAMAPRAAFPLAAVARPAASRSAAQSSRPLQAAGGFSRELGRDLQAGDIASAQQTSRRLFDSGAPAPVGKGEVLGASAGRRDGPALKQGSLGLLSYIKVKPGAEKKFIEEVAGIVEFSRSEAGNVAWYVQQSKEDPTEFVFYTRWLDEAALKYHLTSPPLVAYLAKTAPLLDAAAPPRLVRYAPIDNLPALAKPDGVSAARSGKTAVPAYQSYVGERTADPREHYARAYQEAVAKAKAAGIPAINVRFGEVSGSMSGPQSQKLMYTFYAENAREKRAKIVRIEKDGGYGIMQTASGEVFPFDFAKLQTPAVAGREKLKLAVGTEVVFGRTGGLVTSLRRPTARPITVTLSRRADGAFDGRASLGALVERPAGLFPYLETPAFIAKAMVDSPLSAFVQAQKAVPGLSHGSVYQAGWERAEKSGEIDMWYRFYDDEGNVVAVNGAHTGETRVIKASSSAAESRRGLSPWVGVVGGAAAILAGVWGRQVVAVLFGNLLLLAGLGGLSIRAPFKKIIDGMSPEALIFLGWALGGLGLAALMVAGMPWLF